MTLSINSEARVPPGFRFHPTDEELITFYLKKKVSVEKFDLDHVIREVDLNKLEPWDLRETCTLDTTHQTEWYFFSHNDKKYPTGSRTNRATAAGFWKATGRDKAVHSNSQRIGMRKTLVFYRGRAPHGQKTDWIMHEYRLEDVDVGSRFNEDGWVVCRVFKKRRHQEKPEESHSNLSEEEQPSLSVATSGHSSHLKENVLPVPSVATTGPSKHFQEVAFPVRTFACKQEVVECPPEIPFLQLPQLESPKITTNSASGTNPSDSKWTLADSCKKVEHSASFFLDRPATESFNGRSFHVCESVLPDYADNEQVTDWNLFDNISRYNAELWSFPSDNIPQYLIFASRQQPLEYPSSCEVDLWNFTR